jgi:hypothetical protein
MKLWPVKKFLFLLAFQLLLLYSFAGKKGIITKRSSPYRFSHPTNIEGVIAGSRKIS